MEKGNNLVSVIVPVYKKEDTIIRCINSVLNQDYNNLEIIIIDDGSPDNCGKIIDGFCHKDSRIVTVHQKNQGVSCARNLGINIANGKYITFVDADDIIESNFISSLISKMKADVDIVVGSTYKQKRQFCREISANQAIVKMFCDDNFGVCIWGKLYDRRVWSDISFIPGVKMGEDLEALFQVILKSQKITYSSESHYILIGSKYTSIDNVKINDYRDIIYLIEGLIPQMSNENMLEIESIKYALLQRCVWLINWIAIGRIKCNENYTFALSRIRKYKACLKRIKSKKYYAATCAILLCPQYYMKVVKIRELVKVRKLNNMKERER